MQERHAYVNVMYMPIPQSVESPTQIYPWETMDLHIDSLEQDDNTNFEEIYPHQEVVISEIYQMPDMSYYQASHELQSQPDTGNLV